MSSTANSHLADLIPIRAAVPRSVLEEIVDRLIEERIGAILAVSPSTTPWLTAAQAAEHVGVHPSTFRRQAADGLWPRHLDQGRWYYRPTELDDARVRRSLRDQGTDGFPKGT